ncbi:MAG: type 4a pilus biogenesis protein PilO [Nitrospira sp.]|uniref:type 4a pilus biogenesis protein PilO n=1 Tax=Nitrospira sp. BLG_1 TaxID=3395883 RepID=UPI0039BC9A4C|nr:type 4a pilus biogenesis protein PilO [Nitrospira sp.]
MKERLIALLQNPFAPLLPWGVLAIGLLVVLIVVHAVGLANLQVKRQRVETEWGTMRQSLVHHREARNATKDLIQVWALLPSERDFSPLALGISDEAKREGVVLPALSYKTEPTTVAHTTKGLLQGSMSGRYEDLRRFIHDLETADELLLIEDLELNRIGGLQSAVLTFNIKIATYLRAEHEKRNPQETTH